MAPIFTSFFFLAKKIFIKAIPLSVISLCLTSCGPLIYTTQYGNLKQFELPNPKNCQTKGGIDICIEKVLDVEYEKPIYKQNFKVIEEYYPLLSTQKALRAKEIDLTVDLYEDTQPFKVILSNNTDHNHQL